MGRCHGLMEINIGGRYLKRVPVEMVSWVCLAFYFSLMGMVAAQVPSEMDFNEKYRVLIDRNPFVSNQKNDPIVVEPSTTSRNFNLTGYWSWKGVTRVALSTTRSSLGQPNNFVMSLGETYELSPGNAVTLKEVNTEGKTPSVILAQGGESFRVDMMEQKMGIAGMEMPIIQPPQLMPQGGDLQTRIPFMPTREGFPDNSLMGNPAGQPIVESPTIPQRMNRRRILAPRNTQNPDSRVVLPVE